MRFALFGVVNKCVTFIGFALFGVVNKCVTFIGLIALHSARQQSLRWPMLAVPAMKPPHNDRLEGSGRMRSIDSIDDVMSVDLDDNVDAILEDSRQPSQSETPHPLILRTPSDTAMSPTSSALSLLRGRGSGSSSPTAKSLEVYMVMKRKMAPQEPAWKKTLLRSLCDMPSPDEQPPRPASRSPAMSSDRDSGRQALAVPLFTLGPSWADPACK